MSAKVMTLTMREWLSTNRADDHLVAWSENREWRQHEFRRDVLSLIAMVSATPHPRWALCLENNYSFAVALLAVLYSGKTPVLPGHFRQAVLAEQRNEFDALITDLPLQPGCPTFTFPLHAQEPHNALPVWPDNASLVLFTSGSTGKPQKITKPVSALERESRWLAARWGERLQNTHFAATVAPHHMYGLSFAFMLPLSLGLPVFTKSVEYHEQLHSLARRHTLVLTGSPAFLKRLDPALDGVTLRQVFSAGGPLSHDAATLVQNTCGTLPTEIYGTTESGVIAFRQQHRQDEAWILFDDVNFSRQPADNLALFSPLMAGSESMILSDEIDLLADQRHFHLRGRKDRIVKIADQRISLTEIERRLCSLDLVTDVSVLPLEKQGRLSIAAAIVLSEAGNEQMKLLGKNALCEKIRHALRDWLSPVAIPRYWRIVPAIPLNQQGKRTAAELQELFL